MRSIRIALIVALGSLLFSCSTLQVNTDYVPGTDFTQYKSFTIQKADANLNPMAAERLDSALAAALKGRGLSQVEDGGDLKVFTHIVVGKETRVDSTGYGGYGYRWGGGMQTTTVRDIPTGTLIVDLVDAKANTAVWRGIAKDTISTSATPEERQQKATQVCTELFANFPPQPKK
jgi:hypothetical protein